mgnify:FL=1
MTIIRREHTRLFAFLDLEEDLLCVLVWISDQRPSSALYWMRMIKSSIPHMKDITVTFLKRHVNC